MSDWPHTADDLISFFIIAFVVLIPVMMLLSVINSVVINL